MPVEFDLSEQEGLTENAVAPENYGAAIGTDEENGVVMVTNEGNLDDDSDSDDSFDLNGGERSFRDSKALPNVVGQLNASNVWMSTRNVLATMKGIDRTESGHFANDDDEHYKTIPSLVEENVALVCDANLHSRDMGGLYYDEESFYNNAATPRFVVTVNPFIFQKIFTEVWYSTSVPCGMYFCCQGGDGAHTGEAHEDFVSIHFAWGLVAVAFAGIFILAALPGDEEWNLD